MRIEPTVHLIENASYPEPAGTESQVFPVPVPLSSPAPAGTRAGVAGQTRGLVEGDSWRVDEHWTAVSAYLADMYLPNEG